MNKWISVLRSLPKNHQEVLVVVRYEDSKPRIVITYFYKGEFEYVKTRGYVYTHWMPMLEIPNDAATCDGLRTDDWHEKEKTLYDEYIEIEELLNSSEGAD